MQQVVNRNFRGSLVILLFCNGAFNAVVILFRSTPKFLALSLAVHFGMGAFEKKLKDYWD